MRQAQWRQDRCHELFTGSSHIGSTSTRSADLKFERPPTCSPSTNLASACTSIQSYIDLLTHLQIKPDMMHRRRNRSMIVYTEFGSTILHTHIMNSDKVLERVPNKAKGRPDICDAGSVLSVYLQNQY